MKIGLCCHSDMTELAYQMGFDYVELNFTSVAELSDEEFLTLLEKMKSAPIPVVAMNCMVPGKYSLCREDYDWDELQEFLERGYSRAEQLGAKIVVFGSGGARRRPEEVTEKEAYARIAAFLRKIAPLADAHGIEIAVEPLRPQECNLFNYVKEVQELIRMVDVPNVAGMADQFHMEFGKDSYGSIKDDTYLAHAHMACPKDRVCPRPGDGYLNSYVSFFHALKRCGYDKQVSVECNQNMFTEKELHADMINKLANKTFKVGIAGLGGMGTTHAKSLKVLSSQMNLEVTAIADGREEKLNAAHAMFPNAAAYTSAMEMIEKEELDILHICLPSYLHADHAVAAMEKGIHVMLEKPVCLSEEDCDRLMETQRRTGVKVMAGQVVRFFEEYRFLKDAYDSGRYGKLNSIVMRRLSGNVTWGFEDWFHDPGKSGSVILDLHIHDLDFLRYLLGEPEEFHVRAAAYETGMINHIVADYTYGDVWAVAEGLWDVSTALQFEAGFRACFEKATIDFNSRMSPSLKVYKADGKVEIPDTKSECDVDREDGEINISALGPYYTEIKYFAECVMEGKNPDIAPLSEGVASVRLALAELAASKA